LDFRAAVRPRGTRADFLDAASRGNARKATKCRRISHRTDQQTRVVVKSVGGCAAGCLDRADARGESVNLLATL
jgi:hypothetical protein